MEEKDREKDEEKVNKIKNIRHTIVVYLTTAVVAIIAMVFLYTVVLINAYIPSESMENTLMTGDRVIGNRLAYKFGNDPERFDVIIFNAPDNKPGFYIKRIIGMPGEKVTIKDGKVYIWMKKTIWYLMYLRIHTLCLETTVMNQRIPDTGIIHMCQEAIL